jgi:hypothetical protein
MADRKFPQRARDTEKFWRQVFGAYAAILQRRGKSEFADVWNLATNYALTDEFGWTPPKGKS